MLLVEAIIAIVASQIYPQGALDLAGMPFVPPGSDSVFPLGTDIMGRNIAAGIMHGARVSLTIAFAATAIATIVGAAVGVLSGYFGGVIDHFLMRFTELFQVIPPFLFAVIIVSILGSTLLHIVLAIGVTSWPMIARMMRSEVVSLRERDFVQIATVLGANDIQIIATHILPNALPRVISAVAVLASLAILTESGLAFLGMSDPNYVSWGGMIGASRDALVDAPYMTLIPGAAIVATAMALSLIGDGVSEFLDPRKR